MKVIVSVGGRFHAFNLAQQLEKRGILTRLVTSYPARYVMPYGIPKAKTTSIIAKELLERGWDTLPRFVRKLYNPQFFIHELYDKHAARHIEPSDIFVGWANFSLCSLRVARKQGAVCIIERGSSHILYQSGILSEEYRKFGIEFEGPHPKIVEKELQEYKEADYISIPSSFVRRTFVEQDVPEHKLIQVPYGVDLASFRQVSKEDKVFRVIFAGGMTLRKGVHYLLQAFSELRLSNSELLLIGSMNDEMRSFFKKYKGAYKWIGHVPQGELYRYYSQGSVFCLPSIEEGLAMVIPQAMACGLPVICTTNTGGEDIVRDGKDGFVIPIRDVDALKEKFLYLYEHQNVCYAIGQSAKERVSRGFTWDDYGEKIMREYNRILAAKQNKAAL